MVPCAIGTDTGGSVRLPAAWCGITGLKTTIGRISTYGVLPLTPTLDTPGPMTRSVEDAALLLAVMQGADAHEQPLQRQLHPERRPDAGDDLGGEQRVAAQGEEVVPGAHALGPQHLGPDSGQQLLDGPTGRYVRLPGGAGNTTRG